MQSSYQESQQREKRLPSVLTLRARSSLHNLLRPAPPKRNDTPFNFTDTFANPMGAQEHYGQHDDEHLTEGGASIAPFTVAQTPTSRHNALLSLKLSTRKIVWRMSKS